ncbi:putative UPF0471 protein C1orf63 like protein [Cricetulus griseus]|uniref:Arginine/serine-rich protein 1 n=1 Tax=Cricetulus griseus TaxID=10029 RepID=A0A061I7R4_CRIGR|nr:putative UPF0471 protein C1orf63 like protein [Cricetulus griseus]
MELLEIAKANAAKANLDLPVSLQTVAKETSQRAAVLSSGAKMEEHSEKQAEDETKNHSEKFSTQRNIVFSSSNSIAKPLQKTAKAAAEDTSSRSPKIDKKKVLKDCGYLCKGKLRAGVP